MCELKIRISENEIGMGDKEIRISILEKSIVKLKKRIATFENKVLGLQILANRK